MSFPRENWELHSNSAANIAVFPRIWACFFCGGAGSLKTCGLLVFGLVLTEICLFFADFCFCDCFFFKFYGNFIFQFAPKGILGVFLWILGHFRLVFSDLPPCFLFKLLADFSFCCIFLPTHVGLVFRSNYLFLACFSCFLACFCKITWHHSTAITNATSFANTVLDLPGVCTKLVCFCYRFIFLMPGGSVERKSSGEDRNAIKMENV